MSFRVPVSLPKWGSYLLIISNVPGNTHRRLQGPSYSNYCFYIYYYLKYVY